MTRRCLRVALTGGIATGKSHCRERFASLGVPTIDADQLARDAVKPGSPGLKAVVSLFGPGILSTSGELDREGLARVVFADATARGDLEAIIHPHVYDAIERWFAELTEPLGLADIPLLFETGRDSDFHRVIVAACPEAQQLERLGGRGLTETEAQERLASQLPIADKVRRAHYVIDTSGTFEETDRQVEEVLGKLRAV